MFSINNLFIINNRLLHLIQRHSMSSHKTTHIISLNQWVGAAGCILALWLGGAPGTTSAETLVEPPVFSSEDGVLDIMMVAIPQPIPTISFARRSGARF